MKPDLRIQIYFASEDAPHAPEGPGWYVVATQSVPTYAKNAQGEDIAISGYQMAEIIPRVRLDNANVPKIAKILDKFTEGKPLNWAEDANIGRVDMSLDQAVKETTKAGHEALMRQIAQAEDLARRIDNLRARAEEFNVGE